MVKQRLQKILAAAGVDSRRKCEELIEQGLKEKDIIEKCYPDITTDDIKACLHYAAAVLKNEEVIVQEVV